MPRIVLFDPLSMGMTEKTLATHIVQCSDDVFRFAFQFEQNLIRFNKIKNKILSFFQFRKKIRLNR